MDALKSAPPGLPDALCGEEELKVIEVITAESDAWLRGDFDEWKTYWVQDERAQHINANSGTSNATRLLSGFSEIRQFFEPLFRQVAAEGRQRQGVKRQNWRINISTNMAWTTFDEILPVRLRTATGSGLHNEVRVLERVENAWKIVAVVHIPNRYGYYASPWVRVDAKCRVLDSSPKFADHLSADGPLRLVGQRLCCHSKAETVALRSAVCEADRLIGNRIARRPVPVLLRDCNGKIGSPCWLTIADMMIVILLHSDRLLSEAIEHAGDTLGLTTTQIRIAESIARGHNLNEIAQEQGVRPNTVRTHVRRMFDKINVNSQPALVRAILSLSPPP